MVGPCAQCVCAMGVWNGRRDWLLCANYPGHEGELSHVSGTGIVVDCRRFRRKWEQTAAEVSVSEGVRFISLGHGHAAMVDAADFEWLNRHTWRPAGGPTGYAMATVDGKRTLMHRLIMNPPPGFVVDHFNGNKHDNRRSNLRVCTQSENRRNARKFCGASRFKGVSWSRWAGKWQAGICHNGKSIHLGYFDDEIDAALAYDRKARELFGAFAYLNFPDGGNIVRLSGRITAHSHVRGRLVIVRHRQEGASCRCHPGRAFGIQERRRCRPEAGDRRRLQPKVCGLRPSTSAFRRPALWATGPPGGRPPLFDNFIVVFCGGAGWDILHCIGLFTLEFRQHGLYCGRHAGRSGRKSGRRQGNANARRRVGVCVKAAP